MTANVRKYFLLECREIVSPASERSAKTLAKQKKSPTKLKIEKPILSLCTLVKIVKRYGPPS